MKWESNNRYDKNKTSEHSELYGWVDDSKS